MTEGVNPLSRQYPDLTKVELFKNLNVIYEKVSTDDHPASNQGDIYDVVEISSAGLDKKEEMAQRPAVVKIKSNPV